MLVKNRQTNKVVELEVIDPKTGNNYVADLVGNNGGFSAEVFASPEEKDYQDTDAHFDYVADTDTIEWWQEALQGEQEFQYLKSDFIAQFGQEALLELLEEIQEDEFEEYNRKAIPLLKEKLS